MTQEQREQITYLTAYIAGLCDGGNISLEYDGDDYNEEEGKFTISLAPETDSVIDASLTKLQNLVQREADANDFSVDVYYDIVLVVEKTEKSNQ